MTTPRKPGPQSPAVLSTWVQDVEGKILADVRAILGQQRSVFPEHLAPWIAEQIATYRAIEGLRSQVLPRATEIAWLRETASDIEAAAVPGGRLEQMTPRANAAVWFAAHKAGHDWDSIVADTLSVDRELALRRAKRFLELGRLALTREATKTGRPSKQQTAILVRCISLKLREAPLKMRAEPAEKLTAKLLTRCRILVSADSVRRFKRQGEIGG